MVLVTHNTQISVRIIAKTQKFGEISKAYSGLEVWQRDHQTHRAELIRDKTQRCAPDQSAYTNRRKEAEEF